MRQYHVYVLTNRRYGVLYTGVTSDLPRRLSQHREKSVPGFTDRYNATRLVYLETTADVRSAIAREKQIKSWVRQRKIELIERINPEWRDLSVEWT
jgi:putative endonuclease